MTKRKVIPSLRSLADQERATAKKARASWQMFTIMAEFIEATEYLSEIRPAVSIYGSARLKPNSPYYKLATQIARKLSDAGFAVISGGGPGIMEAANKGAHAGKAPSVGRVTDLAVLGYAADDVAALMSALLDNATRYSPDMVNVS